MDNPLPSTPSQAHLPESLYPLSGGKVTGSGGDPALEDAPPEFAFDGDPQNRWVDIKGGEACAVLFCDFWALLSMQSSSEVKPYF